MDTESLLREIRKLERVCVFIDNSNLFHAMRSQYDRNTRIDYMKLKELLAAGRSIDCRFYYSMPTADSLSEEYRQQYEKSRKFYEGLGDLGFHLTCLPLRERVVNDVTVPTEKGLDCEIVYDMCMLSRAGTYNSFVLVAGDEDYARTVRRIRSETGLPVDVAFFGGAGMSTMLAREASRFVDLAQVPELFHGRQARPSRRYEPS